MVFGDDLSIIENTQGSPSRADCLGMVFVIFSCKIIFMREFLESAKAICIEIIGLLGGVFWWIIEGHTFEPLILGCSSGIGLFISILLILLPSSEPRPRIEMELVRTNPQISHPKVARQSPRDETGKHIIMRDDGEYFYEITYNYILTLRNNSPNIAYNVELYYEGKKAGFFFNDRHNPLNPIVVGTPVEIRMTFQRHVLLRKDQKDEFLKNKFPFELDKISFIASYQGEKRGKPFFTRFSKIEGNSFPKNRFGVGVLLPV